MFVYSSKVSGSGTFYRSSGHLHPGTVPLLIVVVSNRLISMDSEFPDGGDLL